MRRVRGCRWGALVALTGLGLCGPAAAEKLFSSRIDAGGDVATEGTDRLLDVPDLYDSDTLDEIFPGFDPSFEGFTADINLRGVPANLSFTAADQTLEVQIPGVIDPIFFDEGSLDANLDALEDWFEGDWDSATAPQAGVDELLRAWVAESPVEPVAGNPNSLMTRMTNADFQLGGEGPFLHGGAPLAAAPGQTGIGLGYSYAKAGPWDVNAYEFNLDHRFNFRSLPWMSVLVSLPLAGTETQGSWTGMGSLGLGVQFRPTRRWTLTPMVRVGAAGSVTVGAAAMLLSTTLTSHTAISLREISSALPDVQLGFTNQAGYAQSIEGITIGDFKLDYGLKNGILRNGGYFAGRFGTSSLGWKLFGNQSHWLGDDQYLDSYANLGAEVQWLGEVAGQSFQRLTLSLSYVGDFGNWDALSVGLRGRF